MQEIDQLICKAIDLMVDGKGAEAEKTLENAIARVRARLASETDDGTAARLHERKGDSLALMAEHEQALLSYEEGLKRDPASRDLLWKIVSVLLENLERPEEALSILEKNLLPLDPENQRYLEARDAARAQLRHADGTDSAEEGGHECGCGHDHGHEGHGHDGSCGCGHSHPYAN
ncbi:MAG: hypothetical protein J6T45_04565 [Fibrobacterales bacterium]|nr:hypothetical protein [Fibrobacterales bacterium]